MNQSVSISNLTKRYDEFELGPLSIQVPKGYVTMLAGDNGAGKTTLLNILADLVRPDSGEVKFFDEGLSPQVAETRARAGFLFEDLKFFPELDSVQLFKFLSKIYPKWNQELAEQLVERLDIPKNRQAAKLSRGQSKKLKFIAAIAHEPELLVLDEPFEALDPVSCEVLMQVIREYQVKGERTVFVSSHRLVDIESLTDFVVIVRKGKLVFQGPITELAEQFKEPMNLAQMVTKKLMGK